MTKIHLEGSIDGQVWQHHEGDYYVIVGLGIDTTTGHIVVVYRDRTIVDSGGTIPLLYTRPLNEFLGTTEEHKQRFKL